MPEVLLAFLDGEVMSASTELVDFLRPVLQVTSEEPGSNNPELTVPLSSLKYIVFGGEETPDQDEEHRGKVVIHFVDGEVMRAYVGKDTLGGQYGVIYTLIDPERQMQRRVGVPYSAVKAIFKVRQWDSRRPEATEAFVKVAKILARREETARAERAGKTPAPRRRRPLLERTHRT